MSDKRRYGMGRVYQRGETWWVGYSFNGQEYRESAHSEKEADAIKLLKKKIAEQESGHVIGAGADRITVSDLCDDLIACLKLKGAKSVSDFESHLKPIRGAFAKMRAAALTTEKIRRYIEERQGDGYANATINRQTGALRQALNLARKEDRLRYVPHVPMLALNNARQGFFERADVEAVIAALPDPIDDIARFAYLTGWRKGEILPLGWSMVDRQAREIRLADSKNGTGRVLGYEKGDELDTLIEKRWKAREHEPEKGQTAISEYVFHQDGAPVVDFRKRWAKACKDAKVPGRLFHDLRRTAIRDMVRGGVPETVAMSISGHKTRSVFDRYNITSEEDRREALRRVQAYRATLPAERTDDNVVPMRGGK